VPPHTHAPSQPAMLIHPSTTLPPPTHPVPHSPQTGPPATCPHLPPPLPTTTTTQDTQPPPWDSTLDMPLDIKPGTAAVPDPRSYHLNQAPQQQLFAVPRFAQARQQQQPAPAQQGQPDKAAAAPEAAAAAPAPPPPPEDPEQGRDWQYCYMSADARLSRNQYSLAELRDKARRGELRWGSSVLRSRDGLWLQLTKVSCCCCGGVVGMRWMPCDVI
jgi:hypothetical protein